MQIAIVLFAKRFSYPTVNTFLERDNKDLLYCIVLFAFPLHIIIMFLKITMVISIHINGKQ